MSDLFEGIDARGVWESVPDAMLLVHRDGTIRLANLEAERMFGRPAGLVGVEVEALLPAGAGPAHAELRARFHDQPHRRTMGAGLRLEARREDGSTFPVQISLSPLGAQLVIAAVRDVSDVVAAEERLVDSTRRRILAEDHERIAKDMHDMVIQELFALGMSLQATVAGIEDPDQAARVEASVSTLDDVIRSIRALIFDIRHDHHRPDDLRVRVVEIATSLIPSLGFEPSVAFHGPVDDIPEAVQEHVLAVSRESLTNVARHAEATAAAIEVSARDGKVTVTVSDDGVGMPTEPIRRSGHTNLAERARLARGTFSVAAHPEGGTTVEWTSPLPA
ncbi:MAG: PAS domain S-box protein [Acidimicrobiales bacterium]